MLKVIYRFTGLISLQFFMIHKFVVLVKKTTLKQHEQHILELNVSNFTDTEHYKSNFHFQFEHVISGQYVARQLLTTHLHALYTCQCFQ